MGPGLDILISMDIELKVGFSPRTIWEALFSNLGHRAQVIGRIPHVSQCLLECCPSNGPPPQEDSSSSLNVALSHFNMHAGLD